MAQWNDEGLKAPHLSMLSTLYALFVLAILLFVSRIAVRVITSKRIFWDDGWAAAALLCLLAHVVLVHIMLKPLYITVQASKAAIAAARAGQDPAAPPSTPEAQAQMVATLNTITFYMKLQFAETLLFWTCLWLVKASFLSFFKRLTTNVRGHYVAWWIITVITTLSYIGAVITYPVSCSQFGPRQYTQSSYQTQPNK
jgi:hypothetical protein